MSPTNASHPPGREPAPDLARFEVTRRLRRLQPGEPDASMRERVWRRIRPHVDESPVAMVAARLKTLSPPDPSPAVSDRVWDRLQAEMKEDKRERRPVIAPPLPVRRGASGARRLHPALAVSVLVLVITLATVNSVAQAALPGTPLYPVKRGWENAQFALTLTPTARAELALALADRRLAEAQSLVAQGSDPALVAQAVAAALGNLNYAAAYLPAAEVAPHANALEAEVSGWPEAYEIPAGPLELLSTATPGPQSTLATVVATSGLQATQSAATSTPALTLPPVSTSLPAASATPVPPTAGASPVPPSATQPAPTATPTPLLGLPLPTLPLPTLPLPTLPLPTLVVPTLPLPTLGPLFPTRTPTPQGATPPPTRTPIIVLPTLPIPLPTIRLPLP